MKETAAARIGGTRIIVIRGQNRGAEVLPFSRAAPGKPGTHEFFTANSMPKRKEIRQGHKLLAR
jgi:hypothetical protein